MCAPAAAECLAPFGPWRYGSTPHTGRRPTCASTLVTMRQIRRCCHCRANRDKQHGDGDGSTARQQQWTPSGSSTLMPPPPPAHKALERLKPVAQPAPSAPPPSFAQQVLSPVPARQLMTPPTPEVVEVPAAAPQLEPAPEEAAPPAPPAEPPLAGENVMNIVMVGAECAPWSKTGGLGDVMGALPKAFARRGHRVMVVAPRYENYDNAWETGLRRIFRVFNQDVEVRGTGSSTAAALAWCSCFHPSSRFLCVLLLLLSTLLMPGQ